MEQKKTYGSPEILLVTINEDVLTTSNVDPSKNDLTWYVEGGMN